MRCRPALGATATAGLSTERRARSSTARPRTRSWWSRASDAGLGAFVIPGAAVVATPRTVLDPTLPIADVRLDAVVVDADRVLAEPGSPHVEGAVERVLQEAAVAVAAMTAGACRHIFETTLAYAKVREQYGRPIGSFQALKHRLVEMYLAVERATALVYYAALAIAEDATDRATAAAAAKAAAGDCQRLLAEDGLQLHGGIGFTWEHDLHFSLKRAKTGDALFGGAVAQRAALAQLLGVRQPERRTSREAHLRPGSRGVPLRLHALARDRTRRPSRRSRPSPRSDRRTSPVGPRAWTRRMFDAGWLVPGWPPDRGGRNAGPVETLVYLEELMRAGVPRTTNPQGLGIVVPTLFDYGNDEQIRDYAMPILRGERSACLGMSEPGAGSDLASLSTRAVLDGDHFVVNGQKVWTSGAAHADFCFLFCRTDPAAPKHKGISVLLVDMATPGITVRPLAEIVHPERADLSEVFFDDVVVPAANLVGRLNDGWAMANGSLAHERGMVWLRAVLELEDDVRRLIGDAPARLERVGERERRGARRSGGQLVRRRPRCPRARVPRLRQVRARRERSRAGIDEGVLQRSATPRVPRRGRARRRRSSRCRDARSPARAGVLVDRAVLPELRHDDLRRVVGDPAEHHRREGPRAAAGMISSELGATAADDPHLRVI